MIFSKRLLDFLFTATLTLSFLVSFFDSFGMLPDEMDKLATRSTPAPIISKQEKQRQDLVCCVEECFLAAEGLYSPDLDKMILREINPQDKNWLQTIVIYPKTISSKQEEVPMVFLNVVCLDKSDTHPPKNFVAIRSAHMPRRYMQNVFSENISSQNPSLCSIRLNDPRTCSQKAKIEFVRAFTEIVPSLMHIEFQLRDIPNITSDSLTRTAGPSFNNYTIYYKLPNASNAIAQPDFSLEKILSEILAPFFKNFLLPS